METGPVRVTWVGHATVLIEAGDVRLLTDPLVTKRVAHLRRRRPLPPAEVVDVDAVLVSHAHLDHLHLPSLRTVRPTARVICPRGTGRLIRRVGFGDVVEVDVGDRVDVQGVDVLTVPAAHRESRGPHSRVHAPPVGYVVAAGDTNVYFPGDTDLFDAMADLGPIDVALLPIWGWGHSLGTGHLDPGRAAVATELIRPEIVLPIHWGTYAPEDGRRQVPRWFADAPEQFESALADRGLAGHLRLVEPGDEVST